MATQIKEDYLQMYEVYNALNSDIMNHINGNEPLLMNQIDSIIEKGRSIMNKLENRALNVYRMIPKKTKDTLFENDIQIRNTYLKGLYRVPNYIECILFLECTSLLNKAFFKINKVKTKNYYLYDLTNENYSLLPKAYKELNDNLFTHINHTQTLSEYQISCIISVIKYILNTLEELAYEDFDYIPEMKRHSLDENYFLKFSDEWGNLLDDYAELIDDYHNYDEHAIWKADRVEYLQDLFRNEYREEEGYEEWFVKNGIMYNDNY